MATVRNNGKKTPIPRNCTPDSFSFSKAANSIPEKNHMANPGEGLVAWSGEHCIFLPFAIGWEKKNFQPKDHILHIFFWHGKTIGNSIGKWKRRGFERNRRLFFLFFFFALFCKMWRIRFVARGPKKTKSHSSLIKQGVANQNFQPPKRWKKKYFHMGLGEGKKRRINFVTVYTRKFAGVNTSSKITLCFLSQAEQWPAALDRIDSTGWCCVLPFFFLKIQWMGYPSSDAVLYIVLHHR